MLMFTKYVLFLVDFPCWALGSFLYFSVMQENDYGGGRILGSMTCVLRMNGMDGLRVDQG